jgi:hypothetical protein
VPAGQIVQEDEPSSEIYPAGHLVQEIDPLKGE